MEFWTIVGYIAAGCGAISMVPEVLKAYHTHHLQDVSWGMLFLLISSSILWGSYGLHLHDVPLVISAFINFSMESTLIIMKKHYGMTGKPLNEHIKARKSFKRQLQPALETQTVEAES